VERARELLGGELAALVGESYERAYGDMVRVQQLTELEEILAVRAREAVAAADGEHGSSSRLFWLPPPHQEVRPSRDPAGVFEPAEP
jgi:FKBP12-rapamycin complex-associated protein